MRGRFLHCTGNRLLLHREAEQKKPYFQITIRTIDRKIKRTVCRGSLAREGGSLESYWRFRASGVQISPSASSKQEVFKISSLLQSHISGTQIFFAITRILRFRFFREALKKWTRIMKFQCPFYSGREFIRKYLKITIIWGYLPKKSDSINIWSIAN